MADIAIDDLGSAATPLTGSEVVYVVQGGNSRQTTVSELWAAMEFDMPVAYVIAASDETTPLTVGTAKTTFRMPHEMTVTAVRASLTTAQTSGSILTVSIVVGSTDLLSTPLTIDNGEETSTTATTPAVIDDPLILDNAQVRIDIDQVGNGTAKGLKVVLLGTREAGPF